MSTVCSVEQFIFVYSNSLLVRMGDMVSWQFMPTQRFRMLLMSVVSGSACPRVWVWIVAGGMLL